MGTLFCDKYSLRASTFYRLFDEESAIKYHKGWRAASAVENSDTHT